MVLVLLAIMTVPSVTAGGPVVYKPGVTPGMTAKWGLNDYYDASYLSMKVLNVSGSVITTNVVVTEPNNTQVSKTIGLSVTNLSVALVPIVNKITAKITSWNGNNGIITVTSTGFVNGTGTVQVIPGGVNDTTTLTSGSSEISISAYIPNVNSNNIGINGVIYYKSCLFTSVVHSTLSATSCSAVPLVNEFGELPLALNSNTTLKTNVVSNIPVLDFKIGPISLPPIFISGNLSNKEQLALNVPISVYGAGVNDLFGYVRNIVGVSFSTPEGVINARWDQQTGLLVSYADNENVITSLSLVSTNAFNGSKQSPYAYLIIARADMLSAVIGAYAGYFWSVVSLYVLGFCLTVGWDAVAEKHQKTAIRAVIVISGIAAGLFILMLGGVL